MHLRKTLFVAVCLTVPLNAATYYVRPDGNDAARGTRNAPRAAWRSIDRGQPAVLAESIEAGATEVTVLKATHFPPRGRLKIGKSTVTYRSRTDSKFMGCKGAPKASAGSLAENIVWHPPKGGDTVIVQPGVYCLHLDGPARSTHNHGAAVVMIYAGGSRGRPVVYRGEGMPVIDGREVYKVRGVAIRAPWVRFERFDIRRGGLAIGWADNTSALANRVHQGSYGLQAHYSKNVEFSGNLVYDYHGAWTSPGISLISVDGATVRNNTVVSCHTGISLARSRNVMLSRNLVAWCRTGIRMDKSAQGLKSSENNLWKIGRVIWLQRDDQGKDYYTGWAGGAGDIHADPKIVEWDDDKPDFLKVHAGSPCIKDGKRFIGARGPAPDYPAVGNAPGENLVMNPSFESGLLGWTISAWNGFGLGEAGYEIVEAQGAEGRRFLRIWQKPRKGKIIALRAQSSAFSIRRGRKITISFMARSESEDAALGVGCTLPSWQNKSGFGGKVKVGKAWKRFSVTLEPRVYFPNTMWVTFTMPASLAGEFHIDAVKAERGPQATPFSPDLELVVPDMPGMLLPPGEPFRGQVVNRTASDVAGVLRWALYAPIAGLAAKGETPFHAKAGERSPVKIRFGPEQPRLRRRNAAFCRHDGRGVVPAPGEQSRGAGSRHTSPLHGLPAHQRSRCRREDDRHAQGHGTGWAAVALHAERR